MVDVFVKLKVFLVWVGWPFLRAVRVYIEGLGWAQCEVWVFVQASIWRLLLCVEYFLCLKSCHCSEFSAWSLGYFLHHILNFHYVAMHCALSFRLKLDLIRLLLLPRASSRFLTLKPCGFRRFLSIWARWSSIIRVNTEFICLSPRFYLNFKQVLSIPFKASIDVLVLVNLYQSGIVLHRMRHTRNKTISSFWVHLSNKVRTWGWNVCGWNTSNRPLRRSLCRF